MDPDDLVGRYRRTAAGVETQSCDGGERVLQGNAWCERGCGNPGEYFFDIAIRDKLETVLEADLLSGEQARPFADADARLKVLPAENGVDAAGARFWKNGLPRGIPG